LQYRVFEGGKSVNKRYLILISLLVLAISGCINITQPPAQTTAPPVVVVFSATPAEIKSGDSSTLLWNVTGATSVTIDQGIGNVAVAGSKTVSPTENKVYTLTATNSAGTTVQPVSLKVQGLIIPGQFLRPVIPPLLPLYTTVLDLIEEAPNAKWDNFVMGVVLPFPGQDNDDRGFVMYKYNVKMEDGQSYARVLETHPQWVEHGSITGWYQPMLIPAGARFIAKAGFLSGAQGTDGVEFRLGFRDSSTLKDTLLVNVPAKYDGTLNDINVPLDSIAGKTGQFQLIVVAAGTSNRDWAAWTEAKIVK
jgi:hypothetical protein